MAHSTGFEGSTAYTRGMRKPESFLTMLVAALLLAGCKSHPLADYRPLDKAGMWSGSLQEMRKLNPSDAEIAQVVALKNAGLSDELCLGLVDAAHTHGHPFTSAAAAKSLNGANFSDEQILAISRNDQLDSISTDAVMLRLIGLSDPMIQTLLQRRMKGLPTLSSAQIGRLKNTQLSEREIMARIQNGMTDAQADAEATAREKSRAHSGTGFVRVHGRRR
jgi:hypothetical protein